MTHTTPEVEEIVEEFESRYSYLYQGTVYENEHNFSPVHESVKHWLRTTLEEVVREERERIKEWAGRNCWTEDDSITDLPEEHQWNVDYHELLDALSK